MKVGLIGLGLMGRPMGANLLKAGHELTIWNRTASRGADLAAQGAKQAATPRDLAATCEVIITIVSDPPALESVYWGEGGVFSGLKRGSLMIESSTVSPGLEKRAAAAAGEMGVDFLEAPVTGGTWGAEKGELVFMVGGDAATLTRAEPVLGAMGKKWFHLGPIGAGQTVKLAMNLLLDVQVEAFAEALALVTKAGVPGQSLYEVMQSSMGRSGVIDLKGANMLKGEYKPSFPLRLMHKDVGLALDLANQLGVPLPAAAASREVLSAVKGATKEDVDFSALATFWKHAR
jgi:3-hydroxyisobutyrate dehydrogenase-like beta-hydroxyacid dehydrogenase